MTICCIAFYESYLSTAPVLTCRGHVGESCGGPLPPGEPRLIGTTAHEQLITCCAQVGAPIGGSLISGEPRVIGTTAHEQLITDVRRLEHLVEGHS
jgi:hypothetical protein